MASMHRDLVVAPSNTEDGKGKRERRKEKQGAEEMAKWVEYLPYKGENLRSGLHNAHPYVPDTVAYVCNPSIYTARWELER